ncbi:DUF2513 domain-containing protein [Pasteurella multocida]|uniref:DUF2513 domain-containing protein n=1 Tax=Pasteurella multocida TaxID=747 RepID=UPI002024FCEE|nr:DUF2513 domain-containing protein [Pasteurella multocida]URK00513.1 DUF2513 domain-containing protein [Pasteurella multocida]HDR1123176.1 DUF2513 domain-containing protein [Pasteurella multocida]HDR1168982.1 DUF2513 domain-containing protein [Pasteurella multocida]HDR1175211.1 DUF2513 domain-containing protein [Pasteurella multocida]HDR1860350.1 DUF2513 domain-containing protein [Pasteurella multocida]
MKRDWELIRKILVKLEQKVDSSPLDSDSFKGFSGEQVAYHYTILAEAGLIKIEDYSTMGGGDCAAVNLTWQGHEFLDKIRSDTAWNKIKEVLMKKGVDLSFEAIKVAGTSIIASLLK